MARSLVRRSTYKTNKLGEGQGMHINNGIMPDSLYRRENGIRLFHAANSYYLHTHLPSHLILVLVARLRPRKMRPPSLLAIVKDLVALP